MNCKKHPKYKAIYKPRVDCLACWIMYHETVTRLTIFVTSQIQRLKNEQKD